METKIAAALLVYGPLGVVALVSMWVAVRLYRDREAERALHKQELKDFEQRYIGKAETWMEKYHELAKSLKDVLESISKRQDRGDRGG